MKWISRILCDPMDCTCQAPLSMGFFRQDYWSGLPSPSPGDLPNPGIEPGCPALQADSLLSEPPGLFIGDWNAKVGSQEIRGVTGKFGLGIQNEAGQKLTVLPRKRTGHSKHPLPTTKEKTLHMDMTRWSTLKPD